MSTSCGARASATEFGEPTLAPTAASTGAATLPLAATAPSIGAARLASAWMFTCASRRLPPFSRDSTPPVVLPAAPPTSPTAPPAAPPTAPTAPPAALPTSPTAPRGRGGLDRRSDVQIRRGGEVDRCGQVQAQVDVGV